MQRHIVVAIATLLSACAAEPPGATSLAVLDPLTPVPPVVTLSVMAGTLDHKPVDPRPWGEVNERVAPGGEE